MEALPMRLLTTALIIAGLASTARAEEISSVYTELNFDKDCTAFDFNLEGGEFVNLVCNGHGGYGLRLFGRSARILLFRLSQTGRPRLGELFRLQQRQPQDRVAPVQGRRKGDALCHHPSL